MPVWTRELDTHLVPNEERAQLNKLEHQILHEYTEIKADIEDNELRYNLTFTRPFSSYLIPKDPAHLGRERRLFLERLAHVSTVPDVALLSDEFQDELNTCSPTVSDHTPESLPLLLQAFYLKRLSSLTYAKTLHSVRWKRFCRQQIDFAHVEQQFQERSARILAEFNDALQRSQRLSAVRETLLSPSNAASKTTNQPVVNDDYVAYVRYLVCQYRGQKYFRQLEELIRLSHLKFRTRHSSDTQALTINLQSPASPFQTTAALVQVPTIELEQKPTLDKLNVLFRQYGIPLETSKIQTSGDEMELYANIIRHYRTIFVRQEKERPVHHYEPSAINFVTEKRKSPENLLIKKSSWVRFFSLKAERDAQRERDYWRYIKGGKNDELLSRITQFLHVRQAEKAASVLKQYLLALKAKRSAALKQVLDSSTSNSMQATAMADMFWKNIFDLTSGDGLADDDENDGENSDNDNIEDSFGYSDKSSRSARYMKRDEFNYLETLQKLGLDDTSGQRRDADAENDDASESYGLQLSYITLRFLRIRTLRHRCLHELNYLRSLQRTLTIYEHRLSMASKDKEPQQVDQRFSSYLPHTYLFDTPQECTFDTLNYMQSGEHIENVEDFASEIPLDNDGSMVHVRDAIGLYVVYDCALDDVKELEQEIVSIGSYFIDKASLKQAKTQSNSEHNRKIDRFEILYNLWEYEWTYLQYKRKIIDCYYEIYQHTFDHDERRLLSQIIVDLTARRPRIDFRSDDYFSHSYSLEIRFLTQYLTLIRDYIDRHVNDVRQITDNLFESKDFGSFFSSARSQASPPVYLSASKIHSYYLFEFLESLSSLTRLPHLFKRSFQELIQCEQLQRQKPLSLTEEMLFELEYLDEISRTYKQLDQPGSMFSSNHQRDLFNSLFSEHPTMMGQLAYEILKQIDEARTTKKEQYDKFMKLNTSLIELITLRYRLICAASESEILTSIYRQQLEVMSIDQSHLFLRFVQFEFAQPRNLAYPDDDFDHEPSQTADGRLDKVTGQQHLPFAMQELDEGTLGRLNFRQKDQWLTMIHEGEDVINNLKTVLRLQLMHNQFVRTAVLQHRIAIVCITQQLQPARSETAADRMKTPPIGKRPMTGVEPTAEQPSSLLNNVLYENTRRKMFRENYFISIQFEKTPCRDRTLNQFLRQRELKPLQYQQPREAEKLKRSLLNEFVDRLHQRNAVILLRLQIVQSYLSLIYLVQQFPLTSRTHFMWPKRTPLPLPNTAATASISADQPESASPTPVLTDTLTSNGYHSRPKRLISDTNVDVSNLWYVPSFMEQLNMFRGTKLDFAELRKRLHDVLRMIASLNDLVHIVVAYAQLNTATNNPEQRFSDRSGDLTTFDQSGEFASELHEIQREIEELPSLSLSLVADLLETKRRLTIFQIYYSIAYLIPNNFLTSKNHVAFEHVRSRFTPIAGQFLGEYERYHPTYSILPSPILSIQPLAKRLYPWTTHEHQYNINAKSLWWPQYSLMDLIQLSLTGLKAPELAQANAELVGAQVMLQNIDEIIKAKAATAHSTSILRRQEVSSGTHLAKYLRLELYIVECIRLEIVRYAWSTAKLNVQSIDTLKTFDDASASFRDEIRSPVLRQLSTAVGYSSFYNDFPMALASGQLAPSVTEYECKRALVMRILVELEGKFMMNDTLKRLKRERTLVLSERSREENSIPTDLWKKQMFTENFSVLRPHILDEFALLLSEHELKDEQSASTYSIMAPATDEHGDPDSTMNSSVASHPSTHPDLYCIRKSDLALCLKELGNHLMKREHDNYLNYSSYYENLLYNARQVIGLREQEINGCRSQLRDHQSNLELECQLLTLSAYFDLITELIQKRSTNNQLQLDKRLQFDQELIQIRERFQSINEQLLKTNLFLRTRFEQFREQLYHSTITIVKDIRAEVYKMARTKLTSDAKSIVDQQHSEQTKLIQTLQDEMHQGQKKKILELSQREQQWRREQITMEKSIDELHYELDRHQKRYVYHTRKQMEEIHTLKKANNYLRKRIIFNENQYKKMREAENKSEGRASMERNDSLRQALNQKQIIETKLRCIQEKSEQLAIKDQELERKTTEYERENQAMRLTQTYVRRDLVQTKKKLEQERASKYDAFHQVETLRTNLNEIEEELEQIAITDGGNSLVSASVNPPPPSRLLGSSRAVTPYQLLLARNRPMTSTSPMQRDKPRLSASRLRCYSTTPTNKRPQTANVHIEQITPLTEELLTNLGASTSPASPSVKMLRIKSAKT